MHVPVCINVRYGRVHRGCITSSPELGEQCTGHAWWTIASHITPQDSQRCSLSFNLSHLGGHLLNLMPLISQTNMPANKH